MKSLYFCIITILMLARFCGAAGTNATSPKIGERLVLLSGGESGIVSYGLYCAVSSPTTSTNLPSGMDLILLLRNIGARNMNMNGVSDKSFSLKDSTGKSLIVLLNGLPQSMGYTQPTVIHLTVASPPGAPEPWTLRFKSQPDVMVPVDITISNIEPSKAVIKN